MEKRLEKRLMALLFAIFAIFIMGVVTIGIVQLLSLSVSEGQTQFEIVSKYRIAEQYYFDLHSFRNGVECTIEVNMTVYYLHRVGNHLSSPKVREISI